MEQDALAPGTSYNGLAGRPLGTISQAVAKEKAAIDHEITILHRALEEAHTLISSLETAVNPVSTQLPPTDNAKPQHEAVGSSRVYTAIHEAVTGIHVLQDRVATVLRNLEV